MKKLFSSALLWLSLWKRRVDSTMSLTGVLCLYCLGLSRRPLISEVAGGGRFGDFRCSSPAQHGIIELEARLASWTCSLCGCTWLVLTRTLHLPKCSAAASWNSSFLNMGVQIFIYSRLRRAYLVAQLVKSPPAMRETWVRSLGWEEPLEKGKATCSSILAWRIPWTV